MTMYLRLAKELKELRSKTLVRDGLALETDIYSINVDGGVPIHATATTQRGNISSRKDASFVVLLAGPRGSPYEGGVFRLQVVVPPQYPMDPPKIKFETCLFHPNVGSGHTPGAICLDILRREAWSPALTLERTMLSIASLMADPNPASPMNSEAARLYQQDRPAYDRRVRDWVAKHARPAEGGNAWSGDFGSGEAEGRPAPAPACGEEPSATTGCPAGAGNAEAAPAGASHAAAQAALVIDVSESDDEPPALKRPRCAE